MCSKKRRRVTLNNFVYRPGLCRRPNREVKINVVKYEEQKNILSENYQYSQGEENFKTNFIPLRAKQVGEFIKIRHKKISPTRILKTLECLSLCDSVTLSL